MRLAKVRDVKTPTRGTPKSAGIDFYVPNDFPGVVLTANQSAKIPSGIKCEVPEGYALIAFNKSGVALKGLAVGACVVDEDYQGEVNPHVFNHTSNPIEIKPGEKLMQFILIEVFYDTIEEVELENLFTRDSDRGEGGFGSTNHK